MVVVHASRKHFIDQDPHHTWDFLQKLHRLGQDKLKEGCGFTAKGGLEGIWDKNPPPTSASMSNDPIVVDLSTGILDWLPCCRGAARN